MSGIEARCDDDDDERTRQRQHRKAPTFVIGSVLVVPLRKLLLLMSSRNPYWMLLLVTFFQIVFVHQLAVRTRWTFSNEAQQSLTHLSSYASSSPHLNLIPSNLRELYESVRRKGSSQSPQGRSDQVQQSCPSSLLLPVYGPQISSCNITVLVMDPRLGHASAFPSQSLWFSLDSIAFSYSSSSSYSDVCVALLTLPCVSKQHTRDVIYSKSLPLFRRMIDQQRVRVGFLDPNRYNLPSSSCDFHTNPTEILLHSKFWTDEFTPQDSDLVLMTQDDAVVCRRAQSLIIGDGDDPSLSSWAYAGAVWPTQATRTFPLPQQGLCRQMPSLWYSWTRPQRRWFLQHKNKNSYTNMSAAAASSSSSSPLRPPFEVLNDELDLDCRQPGIVGNGGFSLKSRAWMTKVIETCPHVKYSGIKDVSRHACKVLDEIQEDVYFSTILHGLQAPLPTLTQAAEFAVEGLFLEDVLLLADDNKLEKVAPASKGHNPPQIKIQGKSVTIPFAFHKPWLYLPKDVLVSPEMDEACPFLHFMLDP